MKLLLVDKENTSGIETNIDQVDDLPMKSISTFVSGAPAWLSKDVISTGIFIHNNQTHLFHLLSNKTIPEAMQKYGAAAYHQKQNLAVSVPTLPEATSNVYYNLLHEILDTQEDNMSMIEAEKKVITYAKQIEKEIDENLFLNNRLGFFEGVLQMNNDPDNEHGQQIRETIILLKEEVKTLKNNIVNKK